MTFPLYRTHHSLKEGLDFIQGHLRLDFPVAKILFESCFPVPATDLVRMKMRSAGTHRGRGLIDFLSLLDGFAEHVGDEGISFYAKEGGFLESSFVALEMRKEDAADTMYTAQDLADFLTLQWQAVPLALFKLLTINLPFNSRGDRTGKIGMPFFRVKGSDGKANGAYFFNTMSLLNGMLERKVCRDDEKSMVIWDVIPGATPNAFANGYAVRIEGFLAISREDAKSIPDDRRVFPEGALV